MEKNYAYLSVLGQGDVSLVTERLELQPTKAWNAGDPRPSGGTYSAAHWAYESTEFEKPTLEQAIVAVLSFIKTKHLNLALLPAGFFGCIQCVVYHESSISGFHLSRELVTEIASLSLSLDFDLYCHAQTSRS